jgi:hypothetical protein
MPHDYDHDHEGHESVAVVACSRPRQFLEQVTGFNKAHGHGNLEASTRYRPRFLAAGVALMAYSLLLLVFARGTLAGIMRGLALENAFDGGEVLILMFFHHDPFDYHDHSRVCNVSRVAGSLVCLAALGFIGYGAVQAHEVTHQASPVVVLMMLGVLVNIGAMGLMWSVPGAIGRPLALHLMADVPVAGAILLRSIVVGDISYAIIILVLSIMAIQVLRELGKLLLGLHGWNAHIRAEPHVHH